MPPPPLPHRSTGAPCPLSTRQLLAYQYQADGWPLGLIARELGLTPSGLHSLLNAGQRRLARTSREDARGALREAGWITDATEVDGFVRNYLTCWEAYAMAPPDRRDDMPVGELYRLAVHEAAHPPCSWVCGEARHGGEVSETAQGRPLCANHHAELQRARERRNPR